MSGRHLVAVHSWDGAFVLLRLSMLKEFVARGWRVTALGGRDPELERSMQMEDIGEKLAEAGIELRHMGLERAGANPLQDLGTLRELRRAFKELKPDAVLTNTVKPVIYGSIAARQAGVPKVYSMISGLGYAFGDGGSHRLVTRVVKGLYGYALKRNDAVFFQNPDDRALFLKEGLMRDPEKAVLIGGSGVDVDRFDAEPPPPVRPSFLVIARPLKEKGLYEYAEAARMLKAKYPDVLFNWAGILDHNPSCIPDETLKAWEDEGILHYLGSSKDVRPFILGAQVSVLASYYREGVPRSLLESMAMSRPLITTDSPGCRETVIDGENGFLVPPRDAKALAEAMEKFIQNPALIPKMGWRSREIALERFDVRKVNQIILRTMDAGG